MVRATVMVCVVLPFVTAPARAKAPPKPPASVAALPISVEADTTRQDASPDTPGVIAQLANALRDAGYLVTPSAANAAIRAIVAVSSHQTTVPFAGVITEREAALNLIGADNSQLLAQMTVSFDIEDGQVVRKPFDKAVAQFGKANLEAFARDLSLRQKDAARRRESEQRQQVAAAADAARKEQAADEKQWTAAGQSDCADAKTLFACDGVRAYLSAFPNGRHSVEARQVMTEAEPSLKELEAGKAWRAIDVTVCRRAASSDACSAVEEYVANFPSASNIAEAQALLKQAAPRLKAAQKREQAKADAADDIAALCQVMDHLDKLKAAETLRVRVDRKSGTTNLYLKRKIAEGLIVFGDRQRALQQALKAAGVAFHRAECPESQDDESEDEN